MNRLVILTAVGLAAGCGGNEPSDNCASVTPTVTIGASDPVFDWSSECAAGLLVVTPASSSDVYLWSLAAAPGTNTIRGPVTYGIVPEGSAAVGTAAEPLISGQQYRLEIRRATGPLALDFMGAANFTLP